MFRSVLKGSIKVNRVRCAASTSTKSAPSFIPTYSTASSSNTTKSSTTSSSSSTPISAFNNKTNGLNFKNNTSSNSGFGIIEFLILNDDDGV